MYLVGSEKWEEQRILRSSSMLAKGWIRQRGDLGAGRSLRVERRGGLDVVSRDSRMPGAGER